MIARTLKLAHEVAGGPPAADRSNIACRLCRTGRFQLRHRGNDGHKFWGCSNYPACKNAIDDELVDPVTGRFVAEFNEGKENFTPTLIIIEQQQGGGGSGIPAASSKTVSIDEVRRIRAVEHIEDTLRNLDRLFPLDRMND